MRPMLWMWMLVGAGCDVDDGIRSVGDLDRSAVEAGGSSGSSSECRNPGAIDRSLADTDNTSCMEVALQARGFRLVHMGMVRAGPPSTTTVDGPDDTTLVLVPGEGVQWLRSDGKTQLVVEPSWEPVELFVVDSGSTWGFTTATGEAWLIHAR